MKEGWDSAPFMPPENEGGVLGPRCTPQANRYKQHDNPIHRRIRAGMLGIHLLHNDITSRRFLFDLCENVFQVTQSSRLFRWTSSSVKLMKSPLFNLLSSNFCKPPEDP